MAKNAALVPKTALITGGSSGIGFEFARIFAKNGYSLVIVAKDKKKLEAAAKLVEKEFGVPVKSIAKDLSDSLAPKQIFDELQKEKIFVSVLVNNAGFGVFGKFSETEWEKERELLQVNMVSLTELAKLFLPKMLSQKSGKILNVASTAAFQPGPLMALYYASKSFVLFFSEAIANELKGTGVSVTVLCPGPTATGFAERANLGGTKLMGGKVMTAEQAALAGFEGLMKGKTIVIPGAKNRALAFSVRFLPRSFVTDYVRGLQEKRLKNKN